MRSRPLSRARLPGRPEGARSAAQVGRGRRSCSACATNESSQPRSSTSPRGSRLSRSRSRCPRMSRRASSFSSALAATHASDRSSSSAQAALHAEALHDVAVALAPVDEAGAEELVRSLACGAAARRRSRSPGTRHLRGRALPRPALSRFAAAHPEIAEVEVNPLLVRHDGAVGLDARIVFVSEGEVIGA